MVVMSETCTKQVPSSPHARSGSKPSTATNVGSDHAPAGSSAVTKKVELPSRVTFVVINQNRPSWCRSVGAYMPSDTEPSVVLRSSCVGRSRTLPIWTQSTRSEDRKIGAPGKYANDD